MSAPKANGVAHVAPRKLEAPADLRATSPSTRGVPSAGTWRTFRVELLDEHGAVRVEGEVEAASWKDARNAFAAPRGLPWNDPKIRCTTKGFSR